MIIYLVVEASNDGIQHIYAACTSERQRMRWLPS